MIRNSVRSLFLNLDGEKVMSFSVIAWLLLALLFFATALYRWVYYIELVVSEYNILGLPLFPRLCHSSEDRWEVTFLLALSMALVSYVAFYSRLEFLGETAVFWMSLAIYFAIWTILRRPCWMDLALLLGLVEYITMLLLPVEKQWMPYLLIMASVFMFFLDDDVIPDVEEEVKKKSMSYWRRR